MVDLIEEKTRSRSPFYSELSRHDSDPDRIAENAVGLLEPFSSATLVNTFFGINVDSSLKEHDFMDTFDKIRVTARRMAGSDATIVVFLDGTCCFSRYSHAY